MLASVLLDMGEAMSIGRKSNNSKTYQTNPKMEENQTTLVRFGIMGCATIVKKMSRAMKLAPNSTLDAIASRSLEKAEAFATQNELLDDQGKLIKTYGSYIELLDDDEVDAIYMPLPTSLHVEWAVLAASKKKHLLLEKPTALNLAQLDQILEACQVNGVQFMDGTMWHHHPRTAKMKQIISNSANFGHIHTVIYSTESDLTIPWQEKTASFVVLQIGSNVSEEVVVETQVPQEALMVQEFGRLVKGIKSCDNNVG